LSDIRLVDAGTVPFIRSQTIYHALGYTMTPDTPDTIVFARPESPYMCLGFFQDVEEELDVSFCKANGLPIVRREQGGGAVYIDDGQLFVQWIFHHKSLPLNVGQRFRLFVKPLIETYKEIGVNAYFHAPNDVHVDGKKIVGTGAVRIGEAEVVTGNFLFDFDFDKMVGALKVPDMSFKEEFANSLRQYLTTIRKELRSVPDVAVVKKTYVDFCERILGRNVVAGNFTDREIAKMIELDAKMQTDEWLFQMKKRRPEHRIVKVHAGVYIGASSFNVRGAKAQIRIRMKGGTIDAFSVSSDTPFLRKEKAVLERTLVGLEMDDEVLRERLGAVFPDRKNGTEIEQLLKQIRKIKNLKPNG